ncbi:MAG: hypothetical protein MHM6MM_007964, partial [Cercozoa sp. M6MM]
MSSSDSDSDGDFGPQIPGLGAGNDQQQEPVQVGEKRVADATVRAEAAEGDKKRQRTADQAAAERQLRQIELSEKELINLPSAAKYERSYEHRVPVTATLVTPHTQFLATASADGIIKLWKKCLGDVVFVRQFRAHRSKVLALACSPDGTRLFSVAADGPAMRDENAKEKVYGTVKVFDVRNFAIDTVV